MRNAFGGHSTAALFCTLLHSTYSTLLYLLDSTLLRLYSALLCSTTQLYYTLPCSTGIGTGYRSNVFNLLQPSSTFFNLHLTLTSSTFFNLHSTRDEKVGKNRTEEILVSNSSLVSGLSEASGIRLSWPEVSQENLKNSKT